MDTKIFGLILVVLLGSGLYAKYNKKLGGAALEQAIGYGNVVECTSLLNSNNAMKIEKYLRSLPEYQEKLAESDGVISAIASVSSGKVQKVGIGESLKSCEEQLMKKLERLKARG